MRTLVPLLLMCGLSVCACGKKEEAPPSTTTATSASAPPPAPPKAEEPPPTPPPPAEPEASPEMKDFLSMLDGGKDSTKKALKKYGGKTQQNNPIGMYALKDAKITKSEKLGTMQCYAVESTAGTSKHDTKFCWDSSGKIAQITDKKE